jgi:DNA invertase Pin-like site-specific DNA recombinase
MEIDGLIQELKERQKEREKKPALGYMRNAGNPEFERGRIAQEAHRNGYRIAVWLEERTSSAVSPFDRPALGPCLSGSPTGYEAIVTKVKDISLKGSHWKEMNDWASKNGVEIITVDEDDYYVIG